MAQYTDNYNLSMPEATDTQASFISAYRQNMEIIDDNLGGGGGSANIVELTQAEYDALPDSKYTDDVLYAIKDVYSAGAKLMGLGDCYSTTEKQIGCWIDGKPIYQRVFDLGSDVTISNSSLQTTTIDASNMSAVINAFGLYSSGVTRYNFMANISGGYIRLQADRNDAFVSVRYVALQYTKTTDTAGSGNWTPEAIPAVHYDGNEKIIGTWFGQTLYEKTINSSVTIPSNDSVDFSLSGHVSNVSDIISCSVYDATNKRTVPFFTIQTFSNYGVTVFADAINEVITFSRGSAGAITINCYITIQYTKTS